VLVAFAATLAPAEQRGRVVGMVTGGIVTGILSARIIAGVLADLGGWRLVYLTLSGLTLATALVLARLLPREGRAAGGLSYPALLRSMAVLVREEPVLRLRAAFAFLIFATFNVLWAPLVLPLSGPPRSLSHTAIGLFGIAGLAGALGAGRAGQLADRGLGQRTTGVALALMLLAWGAIALLPWSLAFLVVGILLLDLAIQAVHVTNQSLIFALRPEARSRMVGLYMVSYSLGSAAGALAATMAYAAAGWTGVCLLGGGLSAAALALWVATRRA
jgi:predicted MFS family arabinose efflux permease